MVQEVHPYYFGSLPHQVVHFTEGGNDYTDMGEYVNWEVLRTLTLQSMNDRLQELEKEYAEL